MNFLEGYTYAVLHCHSSIKDGRYSPSENVQMLADSGEEITVFSLTDHDSMDGVDEAIAKGISCGIEVIPGIEITTGSTFPKHLLVYNLEVPISPFLGPEKTAYKAKEKGGMVVLPHPDLGSISFSEIIYLAKEGLLDGIEIYSGKREYSKRKKLEEAAVNLAKFGSSDSHHGPKDLLKGGRTLFKGKTASELIIAVKEKDTFPVLFSSPRIPKSDCAKQSVRAFKSGLDRYSTYRKEAVLNAIGSLTKTGANLIKGQR